MINLKGPSRIQVAEWIVAESRQVDDRLESFQVFWNDVPNVFSKGRDAWRSVAARFKVTSVQAHYFVARGAQHAMHYRSYVTIMTSD